jgi:hypothetical protein
VPDVVGYNDSKAEKTCREYEGGDEQKEKKEKKRERMKQCNRVRQSVQSSSLKF